MHASPAQQSNADWQETPRATQMHEVLWQLPRQHGVWLQSEPLFTQQTPPAIPCTHRPVQHWASESHAELPGAQQTSPEHGPPPQQSVAMLHAPARATQSQTKPASGAHEQTPCASRLHAGGCAGPAALAHAVTLIAESMAMSRGISNRTGTRSGR